MFDAFRRHWPHYLAEAAGLAFFMFGASIVTVQCRYPQSFMHMMMAPPFAHQVALGVLMGFVVAAIVFSPWGKKSGAHINPAVTLTFWRLGKIQTPDAIFYILFQFVGGALAIQLMGLILGESFRHISINYVATVPGAEGPMGAFIAEWIISFVLMLVLLWALNDKKREKFAGLFIALLIAFYLIAEEPYSGMSLNPARSFASAFAAREWKDLWIYFVAPISAMLMAAQLFLWFAKSGDALPMHPKAEDAEAKSEITAPAMPLVVAPEHGSNAS